MCRRNGTIRYICIYLLPSTDFAPRNIRTRDGKTELEMLETAYYGVSGEMTAETIGRSGFLVLQQLTVKARQKAACTKRWQWKLELNSKGESPYTLFFGPNFPPESVGSVGDIAVQTLFEFQDVMIKTAVKKLPRIVPGKNHDAHTIYYKTYSKWRSIDEDREDGSRRCPRINRPYTTHPNLRSAYVLEEYVSLWRRSSSYFDPKSRLFHV